MAENNIAAVTIKHNSLMRWFQSQWGTFISILFRPLIIIPTILCFGLLAFANDQANKQYSILLNILASISLAFAGGFLTDVYKKLTDDQVLVKKGLSAVRNLSLCRLKITNISKRVTKGSPQEVENLLMMLEKDIANATQEWNDIIPGVTENIETSYILLKEKEEELRTAQLELERVKKESLISKDQEKSSKNNIHELSNRINKLTEQISKLQIQTSTPVGLSAVEHVQDSMKLKSDTDSDHRYYNGAIVRHAKFGLGTVQRSDGTGDNLKVSVAFPGHGVKTLIVKYANLEVL